MSPLKIALALISVLVLGAAGFFMRTLWQTATTDQSPPTVAVVTAPPPAAPPQTAPAQTPQSASPQPAVIQTAPSGQPALPSQPERKQAAFNAHDNLGDDFEADGERGRGRHHRHGGRRHAHGRHAREEMANALDNPPIAPGQPSPHNGRQLPSAHGHHASAAKRTPQTEATPPPGPDPLEKMTLVGTITSVGGGVAIVSGGTSGSMLHVGDKVGDYQVASIDDWRVVFKYGSYRRALYPNAPEVVSLPSVPMQQVNPNREQPASRPAHGHHERERENQRHNNNRRPGLPAFRRGGPPQSQSSDE